VSVCITHRRSSNVATWRGHLFAESFDVFDFDLTHDELAAVDALDTDKRGGPSPSPSPWRASREIPEA